MDEYLSEKEQIQKIRQWWKENGLYIIAGLVLGVAGLAGWNYWQAWQTRQAEAASLAYADLARAVEGGDRAAAEAGFAALGADYARTPYMDQARLMMARLYVETGEPEQAATQLRAVVDTTGDPELEQVARLRLARVLLALGRHDEALGLLAPADAGAFAARYHEARGDILADRGDAPAAAEEYDAALAADDGTVDRGLVQMKREAVGGPAAEAS